MKLKEFIINSGKKYFKPLTDICENDTIKKIKEFLKKEEATISFIKVFFLIIFFIAIVFKIVFFLNIIVITAILISIISYIYIKKYLIK